MESKLCLREKVQQEIGAQRPEMFVWVEFLSSSCFPQVNEELRNWNYMNTGSKFKKHKELSDQHSTLS